MRLVMLAVLTASPAVLAQTRAPVAARTPAAPAPVRGVAPRTPAAPAPVRGVAAPRAPLSARVPGGGYYSGGYGYYPNPIYYAADPDPENSAAAYYGDFAPSPGIIINPNYAPPPPAHPVVRDYSNMPTPEEAAAQQPKPVSSVYFLIATKDHVIYPAVAYWVENGTLNYITQQGVRNGVPLDQVDREFSAQLNKERNIDFALPPASQN